MKKTLKIVVLLCLAVMTILWMASCNKQDDTPMANTEKTLTTSTTLESTTPKETATVGTTPEVTTPEETTPEETTPEVTTPEVTTPAVTTPEVTTPESHVHTEEPIAAVEPTCTETGLTEGRVCSVCGEILVAQKTVQALGHTETVEGGYKASTCTETGLTNWVYCLVCETYLQEQKSIPALGHIEVIDKAVAPTCNTTGLTEGKHCSVCYEVIKAQTTLEKISCNYVSVVTDPTCEAQGYTTHTCSMCKDSFVDTYVDELGHNWGVWEVSGSYTLRNCINERNCGKYQRISSISATYNGIRLLTGESVWKSDVTVMATLSDGTTLTISDFTLENDVMTVDGTNYVTVNFHTASTIISVPAIYNNLPGTTSSAEFTYTEKNDAITITGFVGASIEIIIPAHINRVPVRYIGDAAFSNNENITKVAVPDSIEKIGKSAFSQCKRLSCISFGSGVTSIGGLAFYCCTNLTELNIPVNVKTIANEAHVYNVGYRGVFEGCVNLTKVTIGDDSSDLAETTIGSRAFANCTSLAEVYIGNNVKTIGDAAFSGCTLLEKLTMEENVESIGASAFELNENLKLLNIPNSVKTIGASAFYKCKRLSSISFGSGVTSIGGLAFYCCTSLTELNIPVNVKTIANEAHVYNVGYRGVFEGCVNLTKVTIGDDSSDLAETTIGSRAFANCTSLAEVYIGRNVKTIADNAFEGCASLTDVQLGTGTQSVGSYAYSGCTALTSVVIPANITTLGNNVFNNCTALNDVTFVNGKDFLRSFGSNVFSGCSNLERLYFTGTPDEWAEITINANNVYPLNVTPYFYSENQPSAVGDYWYYNGNNDKRVWNITDTAFEAEFSSENFVEIFGGEDSSYSTIFYNSLSNDTSFKTGLAAWQVLHMVADSSLVDGVWKISEKDLYELAIYDLLCNDANAQTEWLGLYNDSSYAYLSDYIKMFAGNEMTKEILQTYDANIDYCPEEIGIDLSIASMLFEVADNLYDAYLYCARYKAFSDMDQAFQIVLLQIANNSSNPSALREAATECANLYKTAANQMMLDFADKYATAGAKAIQNAFMGDIWSLVTENAFPTLGASVLAARGILLLSNMGFNVDDIYISYYELGVAVKLEGALRNVINDTLCDYYRKSSQESAEQYVYAIGLYKTSVLLGFDYSSALLDERSKAGDIDAEEKQEYVSMINNLASMKQGKEDLYNRFDNLVSQAYVAYYS